MKKLLIALMLLIPTIASADYFARLTWEVPTVRENGVAMPTSDIFGYKIYSDASGATLTVNQNRAQSSYNSGIRNTYDSRAFSMQTDDENLIIIIEDPSTTEYQIRLMGSRTCVWMTTVDKFAVESSRSKEVCIVINPPDSPLITSDPSNPDITPAGVITSNSNRDSNKTIINVPMQ